MLNALEGDYLALCEAAAACGMPTDGAQGLPMSSRALGAGPSTEHHGSPNSKRKNRGKRLEAIIKAEEEHASSSEDGDQHDDQDSPRGNDSPGDSSTQGSPHKRARMGAHALAVGPANSNDSHDGNSHPHAGGEGVPDGDRARIRREKNRVAARKCRAKKLAFMNDLQTTLRDLMRKNEEYKMQVITWHKMFSREVRMREAMKRIIAAAWQTGLLPASNTISAHDLIIGLESGSLDVNEVLQSLGVPSVTSPIASAPLNPLAAPVSAAAASAQARAAAGAAAGAMARPRSLSGSGAPLPDAGAALAQPLLAPPTATLAQPLPMPVATTMEMPPEAGLPPAASMAGPDAAQHLEPQHLPVAVQAPVRRQPTVAELAMQSVLAGGFQWPDVIANVGAPAGGLPPPGMVAPMGV